MQVKFLDLKKINIRYKQKFQAVFDDFLESGQYILGEDVLYFENQFAKYIGAKYCIGVGNGLEALKIILRAAGIGSGDSVIVPSNTYIATWLAVSAVGAEIIPVEPDIDYNIDPAKIEAAIKANTKAILVVHLYGRIAKMHEIEVIAQKHSLRIFEDAAQAHGARNANSMVGNVSCAAGFSFYPGKNLGSLGDGGAITTNDEDIYKKAMMLRNYGSSKKYVNELKGENSRLDGLQARILTEKLKMLDADNLRREQIAKIYLTELKHIKEIELPSISRSLENVWHLFVIRIKDRDLLKSFLHSKNIETMYHYPIPPHKQRAYFETNFDLPISERFHSEVISLPMGPTMSDDEAIYVCKKIREYFRAINT